MRVVNEMGSNGDGPRTIHRPSQTSELKGVFTAAVDKSADNDEPYLVSASAAYRASICYQPVECTGCLFSHRRES